MNKKTMNHTGDFHSELWSVVRPRRDILDLAQREHAVDDLSKDDVLPVKEIARCGRDEELQSVGLRRQYVGVERRWLVFVKTYLAAVRVGTRVGLFSDEISKRNRNAYIAVFCAHHRQKSWTGMFHLEILVLDIDGVVSGEG